MDVHVRLYGAIGQYRPGGAPGQGAFTLPVPEGATVARVAEQLGIPVAWITAPFVNGEPCSPDVELHADDEVVFLPPSRGGSCG